MFEMNDRRMQWCRRLTLPLGPTNRAEPTGGIP
jgi:hypothetical protein